MNSDKQKSRAMNLPVLFNESFNINRQIRENSKNALSLHYHDAYEIYYLISGERYYFIKDKTYHATPGTLVMINPFDIHCTSNYDETPYERIILSFKKSYINSVSSAFEDVNLLRCFESGVHLIEIGEQHKALAEGLLNLMLEEYKSDDTLSLNKDYIVKNTLSELLLLISKYIGREKCEETNYKNSIHKTISEVVAYINNNYSDDITLKSIAERFFISSCYLSRTFKAVTGSSLIEYINGVRIKVAQKLLKTTDMGITEISSAVGFKNTTHFGRIFKLYIGISPLKYRKN